MVYLKTHVIVFLLYKHKGTEPNLLCKIYNVITGTISAAGEQLLKKKKNQLS